MVRTSDFSILHAIGETTHECGYCKSEEVTKYNLYFEKLFAADYELFMLNGWRRSGNVMYQQKAITKGCNERTIILPVDSFTPSKSQRKVLRRFDRYLRGEFIIENSKLISVLNSNSNEIEQEQEQEMKKDIIDVSQARQLIFKALQVVCPDLIEIDVNHIKIQKRSVNGMLVLSSPILLTHHQLQIVEQTLLNQINISLQISPLFLKASLINHYINIATKNPFNKPIKQKPLINKRSLITHSFRTEIVLACEEEAQDVYELYKHFQITQFNDTEEDISFKSFMDFLGQSKMEHNNERIGTFWWKWYLDNNLIGVSVLDFLPNSLSSVYFIYQQDMKLLSIGVLSILYEIELTKSMKKSNYCLGLYIDECKRMKYKGAFDGSMVIDHTTRSFVRIDECRELLEKQSDCLVKKKERKMRLMNVNKKRIKRIIERIPLLLVIDGELEVVSYSTLCSMAEVMTEIRKAKEQLMAIVPMLPDSKTVILMLHPDDDDDDDKNE